MNFTIQPLGIIRKIYLASTSEIRAGKEHFDHEILREKKMISLSDNQVIVFVHGESYEWNSGNPYDGSVLASYGQVSIFDFDLKSMFGLGCKLEM